MTAATIEWLSDICWGIKIFAFAMGASVVVAFVSDYLEPWKKHSKSFYIKGLIILAICILLLIFVPAGHFWKILGEQYGV